MNGMKNTIPSRETLQKLYDIYSDEQIAKQYEVSASTVRRWRRASGVASMPRGPRSDNRPHKVTDEQIKLALPHSLNIMDLLRNLGLCETGSAHHKMKERLHSLGLDTSHFGKRKRVLGFEGYRIPLESYLVKGRRASSNGLKRRLISSGMLEERCALCGLGPIWASKPLTLQLDHVDGDIYNNLRENLRLLCPNCHSQTNTFAGRNKKNGAVRELE
jgi:transposase-like protein